jgi:hypothetical protein
LREPILEWLSPSAAFDDGEPNLFSLMRWDYRLVETLFGRDDDLRKILAWAENGSKTPSARLITGEGGAGKTRLAAMAAQILRETGWTAGFLPRANALMDFTVGAKGLFLILDYPDEQPERTAALLSELAERKIAAYHRKVWHRGKSACFHSQILVSILVADLIESDFSFAELKNTDSTVYLVIPPEYLDTHARYLRLFITLALRVAGRGRKAKHHMLFCAG